MPGGRDIPVTARNRMQYIYAVADWRLNRAISHQSAALLRGLREVLPAAWLAPFSAPELQVRGKGLEEGYVHQCLDCNVLIVPQLLSS
jgi:hypothetical protein